MRKTTALFGRKWIRGERMRTGKGWRLTRRGREIKASLILTGKIKGERIAIFRVLQRNSQK